MAIKFLANNSTGEPFETGETRTVVVTAESLDAASGYEGDNVRYTCVLKDSTVANLPTSFVIVLKIDGTTIGTPDLTSGAVYDPPTGGLTVDFTVPAAVGSFTVRLEWAEQEI